jgi:hypothetical protein
MGLPHAGEAGTIPGRWAPARGWFDGLASAEGRDRQGSADDGGVDGNE